LLVGEATRQHGGPTHTTPSQMIFNWRYPVIAILFVFLLPVVYGGIYASLQAKLTSGSTSSFISSGSNYVNKLSASTVICSDNINIGRRDSSELSSLLLSMQSFVSSQSKGSRITSGWVNGMLATLTTMFNDNVITNDECAVLLRMTGQAQDLSSMGS